jgi:hypothetical protein
VSQRRFSPCGLFSRAEDKSKLSDDVIEEALRDARQQVNISFRKCTENLSGKLAASADRRFELDKRSQLLIRTHKETLSVAAMRVSNPDCTPATKPTGAAALLIVQDCFRCGLAHF